MKKSLIPLLLILLATVACKRDKKTNEEDTPSTSTSTAKITGYAILNKVKGIWNGPITSTTQLGNFPMWIVDFRPIAENQIAAKNELDTLNDIFMSFFTVRYNNQSRVAFRNGGSFNGMKRVSYFLIDSVSETPAQSYYRFSEIVKGKNKAYVEFIFNTDSLILKAYTNKYNILATAVNHMTWKAKLQDVSSASSAVTNFDFPKETIAKDFSSTFIGQSESIYYSLATDPYPENTQPYLGKTIINYTFDASHVPNPSKKVILLITTQPLISGFSFNMANMKYRSRYVILGANHSSFSFNYMHPGTYYVYALYDNDDNSTVSGGDWVSSVNTTFTLGNQETTSSNLQINFTIP